MIIRHWRLFDELQQFQAETNRFFSDLYRRLALLELAMSNWYSLDELVPPQYRGYQSLQRTSTTVNVPINPPGYEAEYEELEGSYETQVELPRHEERPALPSQSTPAVDIYERDRDVVARVELPGLRQGDIEVFTSGRYLIIRGKISQNIPLPDGVNPDRVRAIYRNGVLEIVVPKDAPARKVEVEFE
ncbi:TPA: Hsp20/alpha crystallin family protein [Candidatus Poribacteria bacterium]|nr:Hsp20/alpha crystallin family protein [Candidatus Poribacteria bacterium]HEX29115.1 Hsp20/alpha crystallin family protein [Candidatus Poribacteria bacterium]